MDNNFKTRTFNFKDSIVGDKSSTFIKSTECNKRLLITVKMGDRSAIYGLLEKNGFTTLYSCGLCPTKLRQFLLQILFTITNLENIKIELMIMLFHYQIKH